MTKERTYKKEYAFELLNIAGGDLGSARSLLKTKEGRIENICFLAHQCVEKCLKAAMCYQRKPLIHTHDLDVLVALLPKDFLPPNSHALGALTEYSLVRRYEQGYEELSDEDLRLSIETAEQVLAWYKARIKA